VRYQASQYHGSPMRTVVALTVGAALTVIIALVLGEYPFVGFSPFVAAALVPAIIASAVVGTAGHHRQSLWAATGVLSAGAIAWAVWISTGRGLDPVPLGGVVAAALALGWPLAWACYRARRTSARTHSK